MRRSALLSRDDARQVPLGVEVRERVPAEVAVGDSAVRVRGPPGIGGPGGELPADRAVALDARVDVQ